MYRPVRKSVERFWYFVVTALFLFSDSSSWFGVDATVCTPPDDFPIVIENVPPGGKRTFTCWEMCHGCWLYFIAFSRSQPHQFFVNIVQGGQYVYEQNFPYMGDTGDYIERAFSTGYPNHVVGYTFEFECSINNPYGNCDDIVFHYYMRNCGCPEGQYVTEFCDNQYSSSTCAVGDPPPRNPDLEDTCFSLSSKVESKHKGTIPMQELQVGDEILTQNGNYESVYAIPHYHPSNPTTFVQLKTQAGNQIELTSDHLIYVPQKQYPVPASMIRPGDAVVLSGGSGMNKDEEDIVSKVTKVTKPGFINALTKSGTLVVNNLVASSYVSVMPDQATSEYYELFGVPLLSHHTGMHMYAAPYRLLCGGYIWFPNYTKLCTDESRDEHGHTPYLALGAKLRQFQIARNNSYLQLLTITILVIIGLPIVIVCNTLIAMIDLLGGCGCLLLLLLGSLLTVVAGRRTAGYYKLVWKKQKKV